MWQKARHAMDKPSPPPAATAGATATSRPAATRLRLNSADLFGQSREVIIEHADGEYRLRLTSQGKLILTK